MTRNFGTVLVEGGSGNVYFGTLEDGSEVAVKVFFCFSIRGSTEFQAKAKNLRAVDHENLVPLLGYCDGTKTKALIYEFMDGGNLRQNLSGDRANFWTWSKRLQIALDVAQGLDYLHHGCYPPIIHGDLSAANIWLNEKMQAKIADFGISAFEPRALDSYPTCPLGTPGYFDPEFYPYSRSDRKSDVYSFGIILFELITGQPAVIMDPSLQGKFNIDSAWKVVEIAKSCTRPTGVERPDITQNIRAQPTQREYSAQSGVAAVKKIRGSEARKSVTLPATCLHNVQNQLTGKATKSVMKISNSTCSTQKEDPLLKNSYSVLACVTD
ncbi:probable LRR receptor-like serine/threonine-protein kinase At4g29180 [Eucalyptus grandis]|uniref:probable LRR receptor-like serine/threonine-protein kinase At4g29180 n=1 Tax=Eucalyptus grandis TaxID=71139 RepID=UPI00192F05D9|nr:probable LRR receptor-like serine/threonine-protein kinase At4g29180 [Eucalyptus grandis]